MNPKIKAKWVKRLRSGEYRQGRRALRTTVAGEDHFCCLGVLCEIAVDEGVIPAPEIAEGARWYDGSSVYPPPSVVQWADLPDVNPAVGASRLADLNDTYGCTFDEIADMIEEDL